MIVEMDTSIPDRYSLTARVLEGVDREEIREFLEQATEAAGISLEDFEGRILDDEWARSDETVKQAEEMTRLVTQINENNQQLVGLTKRPEALARFVPSLQKSAR